IPTPLPTTTKKRHQSGIARGGNLWKSIPLSHSYQLFKISQNSLTECHKNKMVIFHKPTKKPLIIFHIQ
ncbi:hypothetical protein, partial [Photobacterium sp. OFAV2-7]|uniref:hypothetical protein n=1 Tax=Photobacterium sp. OFAV2-7 TaxID=2917748 RepID=UPI001EF5F0E2